jgi:hypothetical protein
MIALAQVATLGVRLWALPIRVALLALPTS